MAETKHERFLRLMQRRLERALEELRLVSQLSSSNYENTPEEAQEVVKHLDEAVRHIAEVFEVEYATRIGKAASQATNGAQPIGVIGRKTSVLDEIEIMKVIENIRMNRQDQAIQILRSAITGKAA